MKLINDDCLKVLPTLSDKSVDLILTDPPYGTTQCKWDSIIPFEPMWKELKRIIKDNSAIIFTASQPFTSSLIMSNVEMFKYEWIWQKAVGSNFAVLKYQPMKEHENIIVFSRKTHKYFPIKEKRKGSGASRMNYGHNGSITGETTGTQNFKGWKVGKNKMKDWRAAVRNWERRKRNTSKMSKLDAQINAWSEAKKLL